MNKITKKLAGILNSGLGWNKARADLLCFFIVALLKVRSANLTRIAVAMPGRAKTDSKYKRLQRFFSDFDFSADDVAGFIVRFLPISDGKWDLSVDRTNWKLGKQNINPLVLGIIHQPFQGEFWQIQINFLIEKGKVNFSHEYKNI